MTRRPKKIINNDKRRAAAALRLATTAWQKSTTAWAASTNARIDRVNAHAAANAAQITENAMKANKDLEVTMGAWDHRVRTFKTNTKTARSKLGEQFKQQDKATRSWANNKIKGLVAETAAQFTDVETKMAKNRHEVDEALKQATMRFAAALGAATALETKRYASTVSDIESMKRETKEKLEAASSDFRVSLLSLSSVVKTQVQKVNSRIDTAAGVVRTDEAAQAKVNANINAEMVRMIKLGNDKYKAQLERETELHTSINAAKTDIDSKVTEMAKDFNSKLAAVRKTLAEDRLHAETVLQQGTSAVYAKLKENAVNQASKNEQMKSWTTRMKLDAMDSIRNAKEDFVKKIKDLGTVVSNNDKKADGTIKELAGVVQENAEKSLQGRKVLFDLNEANKNELHSSIESAITKGEKRAQEAENAGSKLDEDTNQLINTRLNAEIAKLRDSTNSAVEGLSLMSKEAREQMKKEMLLAVRGAAQTAKSNLEAAIKDAATKMEDYERKHVNSHADSKLAVEALTEEIKMNAMEVSKSLQDAVAADAKAQLALGTQLRKDIKKTNKNVEAYATRMEDIADKALEDIKDQTKAVENDLKQQKTDTNALVKTLGKEDVARQTAVLDFVKKEISKAGTATEEKYGKAYRKLAEDRAHADKALADLTKATNAALAKQGALQDSRFSETVEDIVAARKVAGDEVLQLRKGFATALVETTAIAKRIESKITGLVEVVSGEVISLKAHQVQVNTRVDEELKRVRELANAEFTENKKARGQMRLLMDQYKRAASDEVSAFQDKILEKVTKARATNAANKREMAKSLTVATENFYEKLAAQSKADDDATKVLNKATEAAKLKAAKELKGAEDLFATKIVDLTNTVSENSGRAKRKIARITGVVNKYAEASEEDRLLIQGAINSVEADLNKAVDRAIQIGEAKAKMVEMRIAEKIKDTKGYIMVELTESCEKSADRIFNQIIAKRATISDNYMSLKAYALGAQDAVSDYITKGNGVGLSAIGDFLETTGNLGALQCKPMEGVGMGGDTVPGIFSGQQMHVDGEPSLVDCLTNEYIDVLNQVNMRWSMGIGSYLMNKLEMAMQQRGVLMVAPIEGKTGSYVYINGPSIGLSNKMTDLAQLAVKMADYEAALAHLTAKVTNAIAKPQVLIDVTAAASGPPAEVLVQEAAAAQGNMSKVEQILEVLVQDEVDDVVDNMKLIEAASSSRQNTTAIEEELAEAVTAAKGNASAIEEKLGKEMASAKGKESVVEEELAEQMIAEKEEIATAKKKLADEEIAIKGEASFAEEQLVDADAEQAAKHLEEEMNLIQSKSKPAETEVSAADRVDPAVIAAIHTMHKVKA